MPSEFKVILSAPTRKLKLRKQLRLRRISMFLFGFIFTIALFQNCGQFAPSVDSSSAELDSSQTPVTQTLSAEKVEVGNGLSCALSGDQVFCWGFGLNLIKSDDLSQHATRATLVVPAGATKIGVGDQTACALVNSDLKCWGSFNRKYLQLSDERIFSPQTVLEGPVSEFSINGRNICAIKQGEVLCLGSGYFGGVSFGHSGTWVRVAGLPLAEKVRAATSQVCVLSNKIVYCWGQDSDGVFGTGTPNEFWQTPRQISIPDGLLSANEEVTDMHFSGSSLCLKSNLNRYFCSGTLNSGERYTRFTKLPADNIVQMSQACRIAEDQVRCQKTSSNAFGLLGEATGIFRSHDAIIARGKIQWVADSDSEEHGCLIQSGKVKCWGKNEFGQLGIGSLASSPSPKLISKDNEIVTHLGSQMISMCAIINNTIRCWGGASVTRDGERLSGYTYVPKQVGGPLASTNSVLNQIFSTNSAMSIATAFKENGVLKFLRMFNVAGLGDFLEQVNDVESFVTGFFHACFTQRGSLRCAGGNDSGQLGNGTNVGTMQSIEIFASGVTAVSAQGSGSCAVKDQALHCWGASMPFGTPVSSLIPYNTGIRDLSDVKSSLHSTCYLKSKSLYCSGQVGQMLGASPETAVYSNVDTFALTDSSICVVSAGKLYCAGDNRFGQLANGKFGPTQSSWQQVNLDAVTNVAIAQYAVCAIASSRLYCWGDNRLGTVGDGRAVSVKPMDVLK